MSNSFLMKKILITFLLFSTSLSLSLAATSSCDKRGTWLQVLGSGGPEVNDDRASSGYLIWHNGHARVLVDLVKNTNPGDESMPFFPFIVEFL